MPLNHLLLALAVVFVWGTNFVVIRWGLDGLPPFLFATLRFAFSALPWLLFVPRPTAPWHKMAAFGVLLGVGQFGLLFLAMQGSISPGLASLVVQVQVFFTIGLSLLLMGERVRGFQIVGLLLALSGLGVIALNLDAAVVTWLGLGLVLSAAFFWAGANLVVKSLGPVNMLHFMVWSSVFAVPPLLALSWPVHQNMLAGGAGLLAWIGMAAAYRPTLRDYGRTAPEALLLPVTAALYGAMTLDSALSCWRGTASSWKGRQYQKGHS